MTSTLCSVHYNAAHNKNWMTLIAILVSTVL